MLHWTLNLSLDTLTCCSLAQQARKKPSKMRWTILPSRSLACLWLVTNQAMAVCPYANQLGARSESFDEVSKSLPGVPGTNLRGRKAEGKKGVFFM